MAKPQYKDPNYMQKWRAANRERMLTTQRAYYQAHRAEYIAYSTRYIYAHYDRFLLGRRAVWANKRYPGRLTIHDIVAVFDRDQRTCYWCKKTGLEGRQLTIEHLKPVNDIAHIVTACLPCNAARKHLPRKTKEELRMAKNAYQRRYRAAKRVS